MVGQPLPVRKAGKFVMIILKNFILYQAGRMLCVIAAVHLLQTARRADYV